MFYLTIKCNENKSYLKAIIDDEEEEVNEILTLWGRSLLNEYLKFIPFLMAVSAVIWATIFMITPHGGCSTQVLHI